MVGRIDPVSSLASIPSPSTGDFDLGPIAIHMYGLMLLLAIAAAVWITGTRWTRRGGDWDLVFRVAVWGVAAGVVGARLYHVVSSWDEVPDPKWSGIFKVWEGGLGVWGGILLGVVAGAIVVRRSGESVVRFMDAVAPGLLVAQGVGRIGNWWNQELFGKPTDLPWGLEIDLPNRPFGFADSETFHPTFLYEGLLNLLAAAIVLIVDRRFRIRPPALFALYVALYCAGRFFVELLRIDPAHELGPLRLNGWVALLLFLAASAFFVLWQRRGRDRSTPEPPRPAMRIPKGRVRPSR